MSPKRESASKNGLLRLVAMLFLLALPRFGHEKLDPFLGGVGGKLRVGLTVSAFFFAFENEYDDITCVTAGEH